MRQLTIANEALQMNLDDGLVKGHITTAGSELQEIIPMLVSSMNEILGKNRSENTFAEVKKNLDKAYEICTRISDLLPSNKLLASNTYNLYAINRKIDLLSQQLAAVTAMKKTAAEIRQSLKNQIPKLKEILIVNSTTEHLAEKFKDLSRRIIVDTEHVTRSVVDTPVHSADISQVVSTDFVFRTMPKSSSTIHTGSIFATSMDIIDDSLLHKQDDKMEALQSAKKVFDEMQEGNIEDLEYSERLLEALGEWINDFDFLESSGIFESEFFTLEIERLKLKFQYDESRIENKVLGNGRLPVSQRTIEDLIKLAEMNEEFAKSFGERYESEWGRKLALNAITLRKLIYSKIVPDHEAEEETAPLSEEEAKLSELQLEHLDNDWEIFVDLCLSGEPFTDTKNESGILQTLELLDVAFELAPPHLADARTTQMVTLWEAKVLKVIKLYELQRKQGTSSAIVENFFLPVIKQIPYYLDRENNVLNLLWNSVIFIYDEEQRKGEGQQTIGKDQLLMQIHQYCVDRMASDDLPTTVISAFPLFPEVCRLLSNMHLQKKEYMKAQEFAIEEMTMYLELDENPRDNEKMLDAWERVFTCVRKTKTKASEQYFLLRDILSEIQVYDNIALKESIQKYMDDIGGSKEVRYIIRYSEQLKKCSKIFFGGVYDDYSSTMDESSLLEEILFNLNSCEGSVDDLITELRLLADHNLDFQTELMKAKEFEKAKKVIEDNLMIRKFTDPTQLTEEGAVLIDPKSLQSYEALIECCVELSHKASNSPLSMQALRACYDSRPSYFPFENLLLKRLWQEMALLQEFHKETLESLYKKYCIDKQKLLDVKSIGRERRDYHKGYMIMRVNKTWQERFVSLQEQAIFFSKSEKALRSRGVVPLEQLSLREEIPETVKDVVPNGVEANVFVMCTPWRDYVVYAQTSEEKIEWLRKIDEFKNAMHDQQNILQVEAEVNKELLARHPLILEVLTHLGTLWEKQGNSEEALVLFVQGLEITVHMNNLQILERLWNLIYNLLLKTKNIYEILEFLEEENDRWLAHGLEADHILLRLIAQSTIQIRGEEDLKLRYMYQIRKYKEICDDIFPGRIYYLNQIYVMMFLQNGSLTEAIALTKDSLELLKRHLQDDELIAYYHLNTWHLLVDLYLTYSKEKERQSDYYGGRIMLQSAFYDLPNKLDPFNERLNLVLDEIYQLYNTDPETQPDPQTALTDTVAFSWMHSLYLEYDDQLIKVYPSEALSNRSTSLNYKKAIDKSILVNRLDAFKELIQRYPYMMNICSKLSKDYYLSHQLELALHMARHSLHVMEASMSTRHREISQQWQFCKKCFLAQRHSNIEFKKFIEEEILLASVFVNDSHPHMIRLKQDLKKIESKIAIFERYIPAAIYYAIYTTLFGILIFYIPRTFPATYSQISKVLTSYVGLWIFMLIVNLDFVSILASMVFVRWPPLPPTANHRASSAVARKEKLKDVGLVISCSNSRATLATTLRAALKVFPPEQIFVSDNGDSEKPTDQTQDICFKITQEYRVQNRLPVDSPSINYLWCSEKSKVLSYWWACKYYCKFKYCMLIDEHVFLPGDLIVPMEHFQDEKIKCLTFTLCANNLFNQKGHAINICYWQDIDLKLDGFVKMFWSYMCSAFSPNWSASLWERAIFLETVGRHTDPERGNDILLGQIFHKLNRDYRIATVGNISIPITVPDHVMCRGIFQCHCHGKEKQGNLFSKVIHADYINAFQFQYNFLALMLFYWKRAVIFLKPFILYELISMFRHTFTVPLWCYFIYKNPVQFGMINSVFLGIQVFLMLSLNYWILRGRPDMQHPILITLTYPLYLWGISLFRFIAMLYNRFYHLPMVRDKLELAERQDLPVDPSSMRVFQKMGEADNQPSNNVPVPELLLQKDSHEWEVVAKLLDKEAEPSPHLSHWFLSCISQIVWKKETPRKQVTFSSRLRKRKPILGRTVSIKNFHH